MLEIGEANWYGDIHPADVPELQLPRYTTPVTSAEDQAERERAMLEWQLRDPFAIAQAFYAAVLAPSRMVAIDRDGTERAEKWDLNEPVDPRDKKMQFGYPYLPNFDIVINTGTIEHVFNQAQCFRTIHDWTKAGGLMVHSFPISGWTNHGFYTYSPCLLTDLAFANGYTELARVETEMPQGRQAHLCWKKCREGAFVVPQQRRG